MASKWLPGYTWDKRSLRYRSGATGRYVKRDTITDLLEMSIQQRTRDLRKGLEAVLAGDLDPTTWLARTATLLKREHLELAALASGGWDRLDAHDYGRIGGRLRFDYQHLAGMAQDIVEGTVSLAQGLNRLDMYLGSARQEFLDGDRDNWEERLEPGEQLLARRHLDHEAIHCQDCEDMAQYGWRPADEVPIPGDDCQCDGNCRCDIEYRIVPASEMEMGEFNPREARAFADAVLGEES